MKNNFSLYNSIEFFIDNKCQYNKNKPFISNLSLDDKNINKMPILYHQHNSIRCILNIPKEKKGLLKSNKNYQEIQANIIDSSFELVIYRPNDNPSIIKCIILLIINDIDNMEQKKFNITETNLLDINNEFGVLKTLKKFLFNYIKGNKKDKNLNNNILENALFTNAINGVKFFNSSKNEINFMDREILNTLENIKLIDSKIEIKQKSNDSPKAHNDEDERIIRKDKYSDIIEVLDDSNSDCNYYYEHELVYKYLNEMPEKIINLVKRYKNIHFTKNMYLKYLNNKNKNNEGDN